MKLKKTPKWLALMAIALFIVIMSHPMAMAVGAKHYTELEFPPLPQVQLPDYDRYQLDNGMVVYLVEDHQLPLIYGTTLIKTGDRLEPADQVGLANIVGTVLRIGGTQQHSPDKLNEIIEKEAAIIESSISTSSGSVGFNSLSEDIDTVFNLFAEVIRYPAFGQKQIQLVKNQLEGSIVRRNDNPSDIASREFSKLIYGENSPYARTVEYQTLANIDRKEIVNFYQTYYRPDRIILGIVGDFEPNQIKQLIEQTFGDWQPTKENPEVSIPQATQIKDSGIFFVNQPQLSQSNILLGHLGGQLNNPDYPAISVLNGLLNGFGGRLYKEVRANQGLAYSVYGYWNPAYDYPGVFVAGGQTRSETTVAFLESITEEVERLRNQPITEAELAYAKESILNSFVFNFQQPSQTLLRLMRYEYYNYPEDFIFTYQQGVKDTTIKDIQRVAQKYLQPEQVVTLVVGNSEEIEPPLSSLDKKVTQLDITISPS